LENARNGATPDTIVTWVATPAKTSTDVGRTVSGGTGGGSIAACACTVTLTTTVCPTASWTVTITGVSAAGPGESNGIVLPGTASTTGSTTVLLEKAK